MYYVYAHKKPCGEIFYIGKGSGNRLNFKNNRSEFWKRVVKKYGFEAFIIEDGLSERESYEREVYWISHYKKHGQCCANFTNGGDGVKVDERWWGDKISKSLKGAKRPRGKESKSYKDVVTKKQLQKWYCDDGLSSVEISRICGVSPPTILERVSEYGLKKRSAGRKRVAIRCIEDGMIFSSISEAANHYQLYRENIRKVLNGEYKTTGKRHFVYAV